MAINGTNGVHVDLDALDCEIVIDGHHLVGAAIPLVDPPRIDEPYLYLNSAQDTLYDWNPITHKWNIDFTHVHNIQNYQNGIANGSTDNTAAAQAAVDDMPSTGGILYLPPMPSPYLISTVSINKPVTVIGGGVGATIIRKFGSAGVAERAIFDMRDRLEIGFSMSGITFDLNGEGSEKIGEAGRIQNATAVASGITSISGPPNSAVFALRCSRLVVRDCRIENTGEVGLLFRNCANVMVDNVTFYNTANGGIEFSYPNVASDGGSGPMPELRKYHVTNCEFRDIDDFGLGSRNAVGVSFAGSASATVIEDLVVSDCAFYGCQRDIHVELQNTSSIERFSFSNNVMRDSRQGCVAIIRGRDGQIHNNTIINPGGAPTAALNPGYPEIYVFYIAVGDNVSWQSNRIYDRRGTYSKRLIGDATMVAGSNTITATTPTFIDTAYVGTWIGVLGAGPGGGPLVAKIEAIVSPFEASLSIPAVNSVIGADFAYGGAVRRGLVVRVSNNTIIKDNIFYGIGMGSGLPLEPNQHVILLSDIYQFAVVEDNLIIAPTTLPVPSTFPSGVTIQQALSSQGRVYARRNSIRGYTNAYDQFNLTESLQKHAHPGRRWFLQELFPSATAATYGTQLDFLPLDTGFDLITTFEIEVDGMSPGEVVDVHTRVYMDNGSDQNVTVQFTGNQVVSFSPQRLALLNRDNRVLRRFYVEARSSISGSTARARVTALALEH